MRLKIAVVGSGISGLSCSVAAVAQAHDVTLFEGASRPGGHSHTINAVRTQAATVAVDMGFIVYNTPSYPNLVALFDHLKRSDEIIQHGLRGKPG